MKSDFRNVLFAVLAVGLTLTVGAFVYRGDYYRNSEKEPVNTGGEGGQNRNEVLKEEEFTEVGEVVVTTSTPSVVVGATPEPASVPTPKPAVTTKTNTAPAPTSVPDPVKIVAPIPVVTAPVATETAPTPTPKPVAKPSRNSHAS